MNPAGTTTGVLFGLAAFEVNDAVGVGQAVGSEEEVHRAIVEATAITTAAMTSIASRRCSHLRARNWLDRTLAATGSSAARGGEGGSGVASSGRGASGRQIERRQLITKLRCRRPVLRIRGHGVQQYVHESLVDSGNALDRARCRLMISGMLGVSVVSDQRGHDR